MTNLEKLSKILQVETHEPKVKGITMNVVRSHLGHWKRYKEKHEEETDLEDVDMEIDEDAKESITRTVDERIAPMKEDLRELRTNFNALVERMKPKEEGRTEPKGPLEDEKELRKIRMKMSSLTRHHSRPIGNRPRPLKTRPLDVTSLQPRCQSHLSINICSRGVSYAERAMLNRARSRTP